MLKLNIGCGKRPLKDGYINIDMTRYADVDYAGCEFLLMDVRHELADWLQGKPIEEIRTDQFLEHLTLAEGQQFLAVCRDALKPDGVLKLSVPDFARHIADYTERQQRVPLNIPTIANGPFRNEVNVLLSVVYGWGHKMIYDEEMLTVVLTQAGFRSSSIVHDGANIAVVAVPCKGGVI